MATLLQERIKALLKAKNMSVRALEIELHLSNGLLMKKNNPTGDECTEILEIFEDVSAEWLMRGEGQMFRPNTGSTEFIELGDNNSNNFSPNGQAVACDSEIINKLLQLIADKDKRINELTDKLLGCK